MFCGYAARFVSDLVGNPEDKFSVAAHMILSGVTIMIHNLSQTSCIKPKKCVKENNLTLIKIK